MPEDAAAALLKHRAVRFDAVWRGCVQSLCDAVGILLLHFHNTNIEHIADCRLRNKNSHAVVMSDTVAFGGHACDRQRHDLIFLNGTVLLLCHCLF